MIIKLERPGENLPVCDRVIILCILAGYAGKEADLNPANSSTMPVQEVGNIESDQIISEQEGFDFFAEYRMERERMRSREVETLKEVINKEDCSQDAKDAAALRLVKISENVEKEVKTESLIKSQGFKDCVVIIQNETTTVSAGVFLKIGSGRRD